MWNLLVPLMTRKFLAGTRHSQAVAVASTLTDRLCIATDGNFTKDLSAQNLMTCGDDEQTGCNGGSAFRAWEFTMTNGIVTGGKFNSKQVPVDDDRHIFVLLASYRANAYTCRTHISVRQGCQPYQRRPCNHYGDSSMKNCSALGPMQPTICKNKCLNKDYNIDYNDDLHKSNFLFYFFSKRTHYACPPEVCTTVHSDITSYFVFKSCWD